MEIVNLLIENPSGCIDLLLDNSAIIIISLLVLYKISRLTPTSIIISFLICTFYQSSTLHINFTDSVILHLPLYLILLLLINVIKSKRKEKTKDDVIANKN